MINPHNEKVALRSAYYLGKYPRMQTASWFLIGQDGGQSIDLGEETLFVFSDTLLAALRPNEQKKHVRTPFQAPLGKQGVFLANCAGLSSGKDLREAIKKLEFFTDDEGFPREILEPTEEEWEQSIRFWPEHGIFLDGKVYLYYLGIQAIDKSDMWGFRNLGAGLAILDLKKGECHRVRQAGNWRLWQALPDDIHFGVQTYQQGEYIYVFGSICKDFKADVILARVKADCITRPEAYEYLSSPHGEWIPDLKKAWRICDGGSEFSVSFNPFLGRYLMVYVNGYHKTLQFRTAETLAGPYSPAQVIGRVPYEPSNELIYLGFEHSKFRTNDGEKVYVSYCQSCFIPNAFVEVRFR
jgi:Domain of unknown function (DUF4185)